MNQKWINNSFYMPHERERTSVSQDFERLNLIEVYTEGPRATVLAV